MKHYLMELGHNFEMSAERAQALEANGDILECPHHKRELGAGVKTYHLTHGPGNLSLWDMRNLTRDPS